MFVKLSGFKEMIKKEFERENLHVMNTGGDYVLFGASWYLCIDISAMPNKAKGAVIELIGEWPDEGEAFVAGKEGGNQMEMIEDERYWLASSATDHGKGKMDITPITLKGAIRLMRQQDNKELITIFQRILDLVGEKYCEAGETKPEGPFLYKDMSFWKNDTMFFAYGNVFLDPESEIGILKDKLEDVI